jgi:hypothetical protein
MQNNQSAHKSVEDKIEFLKRLMVCDADLQLSLSAATFMSEADEDEEYDYIQLRRFKCYETAFVVAYGRAFTNSNGSKYQKLSLKKIGVDLTPPEKELHNKIIAARNKKYAHSDLDFAHTRIDAKNIELVNSDFFMHHIQSDEGLGFISDFLPFHIFDLIRKIQKHLYLTIKDLSEELKDYLPIYLKPEEK